MRTAKLARTSAFVVMFWALLSVSAPTPVAADGCLDGIRAAFAKITEPARKLYDAINDLRLRKGRAQSAKVDQILADKAAQAESSGRSWDDVLKDWEKDVTDRMTNKGGRDYPSVEELLALMAAKSPTFKAGLVEFLTDKGSVRFKVLAHFMEKVRGTEPGEIGGKITYGRKFWELWQTRIKLPARQAWTADDFALFTTEMSNAMWRSMNPEPGFMTTWIKAFGQVRLDPRTWKLWEGFANRFIEDYRARYRAFMEGTSLEAYGRPRPEVLRDFYRFGMWDTIARHLAAFKVVVRNGRQIIETTGLRPEELDAAHDGVLFRNLPRSIKDALIVARDPELYANALYSAEVEQLALEMQWFIRPVIEGLFLYTLVDGAYAGYEQDKKRRDWEAYAKAHPNEAVGTNSQRADDDRIQNYDDQIAQLTIEKRNIERELAATPPLPEAERQLRQRHLDRINRRISNLQDLKITLQRGITEVHPE